MGTRRQVPAQGNSCMHMGSALAVHHMHGCKGTLQRRAGVLDTFRDYCIVSINLASWEGMNMRFASLAFALGLIVSPALAQDGGMKLAFEGDMVRGAGPTAKGPGCVLNSHFKRGEMVVFRIRLTDPKTGKPVDDKGVKSLTVEVSNGEKFVMSHRPHPPKDSTDLFWAAGWAIPDNQPTGSLSYKVTAVTADGTRVEWKPFNVAASQLTVVDN